MSKCWTDPPPPPRNDRPIDCTTNPCSKKRNFVIIHGDAGTTGRSGTNHNVGRNARRAAYTHYKEIVTGDYANAYPGTPRFGGGEDVMHIGPASTVSQFVGRLDVGLIVYLAYFGHSSPDALHVGEADAPDTNLTDFDGPNNTPVRVLPPSKFRSDAQVRLFGCDSAKQKGTDPRYVPIAGVIARHLHVEVLGYSTGGGSIFTPDPTLGHGQREPTSKDRNTAPQSSAPDIWMVPYLGRAVFRQFRGA